MEKVRTGSSQPLRHATSDKSPGRKRVGVKVSLDLEDLEALDELGHQTGRSRSDLMREAIRKTLLQNRKQAGVTVIHPPAVASMTPEEKAIWRQSSGKLLASLRQTADPGMTEEELTAFVRAE